MPAKRAISRADILPAERYATQRAERRRAMIALKRNRRIEVGPYAIVHFENYDTMLAQIHEMLHIEKGGEAQLEGELAAYNPLIPQGRELVATLMFELPDELRRREVLARLGGIEHCVALQVDGEPVLAVPERDLERSRPDGKASAVHFLHFPFTAAQIAAFRSPAAEVMLAITHPNYGHTAMMPETVRHALAGDFD